MTIEISKTNRGFVVGKFNDAYGANCSIQESSNVVPHIWLGSDDDQQRHHVTGELMSTRMHLSREQAAELLPLMQHFVATGCLPRTNDALNSVCEAADALSRPAPVQVPSGWRLVPVEATLEMLEAAEEALRESDVDPVFAGEIDKAYIWDEMLAAAPSAPVALEEGKAVDAELAELILKSGGEVRGG